MKKWIAPVAAVVAAGAGAVAALRHRGVHLVPNTMFGTAKVFNIKGEDGSEVRVLNVGGAYQSATYTDERCYQPVFEYYRSFDHMYDAGIPINRVAMIGGGGCAYPKHLMSTRDDVAMDVVEIDPAITRIARKWFFVDQLIEEFDLEKTGRLNLINADGIEFLEAAADGSYDAIINDSFEGMAPTVGLLATGSLLEAKRVMVEDGLYLLNAVIGPGDMDVLNTFMELLAEAFENVYAIPCIDENYSGEDNYLLVATDGSYHFEGVTAQMSR